MSGKLKSPVSITLGKGLLWVSLLSELFRFSSAEGSLSGLRKKQPVYSALQPLSCILVHAITQSVSMVSSPLHKVSFRTALMTPPPSWPFLHVPSLRTISYRSGSSISDVGIYLLYYKCDCYSATM